MIDLLDEAQEIIDMIRQQVNERDRQEVSDNYYFSNGGHARISAAIRENRELLIAKVARLK